MLPLRPTPVGARPSAEFGTSSRQGFRGVPANVVWGFVLIPLGTTTPSPSPFEITGFLSPPCAVLDGVEGPTLQPSSARADEHSMHVVKLTHLTHETLSEILGKKVRVIVEDGSGNRATFSGILTGVDGEDPAGIELDNHKFRLPLSVVQEVGVLKRK